MFGIGMPELVVIFVIALLVFGPKELPGIAKTIARAMSELRRASDDLKDGIQKEFDQAERELTGEGQAEPAGPDPDAEVAAAVGDPLPEFQLELPMAETATSVDPGETVEPPSDGVVEAAQASAEGAEAKPEAASDASPPETAAAADAAATEPTERQHA